MPHGNSTFLSKDLDRDLSVYRASFELYPYSESQEYALFKGQLTGQYGNKGVRHDQLCTVRTMTNSHPGFIDWDGFIEGCTKADCLAQEFNKIVADRQAVNFVFPLRAEMDTVWNRKSPIGRLLLLWKAHRKYLKEGEVVILEEYIGKSPSTFIHDLGFVGPQECDVLQAFAHFTWAFTNGQLVICGLKGKRIGSSQYYLTDPTIHTARLDDIATSKGESMTVKTFGQRDMHEKGILSFFKFHRCNGLCRDMPVVT